MTRGVIISVAFIAMGLTAIYLQSGDTTARRGVRTASGATAPSDGARGLKPDGQPFPARAPTPRFDFVLVGTEAPGENDRGAAILQFGNWPAKRVAVNQWVDSHYQLTAVGDMDATFSDGAHVITMAVEQSRSVSSSPAAGLPGLDFSQPGIANPAIARR